MNELKVFSNTEFGELGIMMIDGKEYFPATQCAKILGYKVPRKAILDHCKSEGVLKRNGVSYTTNQHGVTTQQATEIKYIDEGNLYRLIVSSKLPAAEKFERWVFDEVLPSIRKNGGYVANADELIAKTASAVVSEVMKQLIPLISQNRDVPRNSFSQTDAIYEAVPTVLRKRVRRASGIISRLNEELRSDVEEMILSEQYTYEEIKEFLAEQGVKLSVSSIWRYAKYLYRI